jgi:two-component system sensor histidine kinase QseC
LLRRVVPPPRSLRAQLTLLTVGAVALIWSVSALVSYRLAHQEADQIFDAQVAQASDMLLALGAGNNVDYFAHELAEHGVEQSIPFVFEVLYVNANRSTRIAATRAAARFPDLPDGFSYQRYRGGDWRFHSVWDAKHVYNIRVGVSKDVHQALEQRIAVRLLLPIALALPLMALAIGWAVRRALRPLHKLTGEVRRLDPASLTPLSADGALPSEIVPLVKALDAAIARVRVAFDHERRFTADAAHELRTPLAALKIQAQVAARADGDSQRHALAQVAAGVDRMTHLVEQLLTLARVQPDSASGLARIDAARVVAEACAESGAAAHASEIQLELDAPEDFALGLPEPWLKSVVNNLVGNALRYAGAGACVRVRLFNDADGQVLRVEDDGVGVPPDERRRLLERFARGAQAHEVDGCGLGLSIVARIAEASGARFCLSDGLPRADGGVGLAAELRWPRLT